MAGNTENFSNVYKDGQVTGSNPDALGDLFKPLEDYGQDHYYWQERLAVMLQDISSDPTQTFWVLYGGEVTDGGSGTVDISAGAGVGLDDGNRPYIVHTPARTGVALPSGWNDGRDIWVLGQYASKLDTTEGTRNHQGTGEAYNHKLLDSYIGEATSDDTFTDSDPTGNDLIWGQFQMVTTTFTEVPTGRTPEWTPKNVVNENLLINGNMDIDQENVGSITTVASGDYLTDQFVWGHVGAGVIDYNQSTSVPNDVSQNSLEIDVTTADASIAAGDLYNIQTFLEGYDYAPLHGAKYVTLSFYVYATVTGTSCVNFRNEANDRTYIAEFTIDTTNTWEKKTITFKTDDSGTWDFTNGRGFQMTWALAAGTTFHGTADTWQAGNLASTSSQVNHMSSASNFFRLSQVKLETGSVATDFAKSLRPFERELALCQRYYEKSYNLADAPGTATVNGNVFYLSPLGGAGFIKDTTFKVRKRLSPTVTPYSTTGASGNVLRVGTGDVAATTATSEGNFVTSFTVVDANSYNWNWTADARF